MEFSSITSQSPTYQTILPSMRFTYKKPEVLTFRGSDTPRIPSRGIGFGIARLAPPKVYTGDKVLGIATMHKSNAVPVFSNQEAIDISKMR